MIYRKITSVILIFLSLLLIGFTSVKDSNINKKYENFSLYDYNNKPHSLEDLSNKKGIVIIFVSTQCPVSNAYNMRMANLFSKHGNDFSFVGINSNKSEDIEKIKKHSEENKLDFTILKDINNVIADKFGASFTPEVYVLSNNFELIYHGRIDDSRREDSVEISDLDNTLSQILNGKEVTTKETKAFGCSIKRVGK